MAVANRAGVLGIFLRPSPRENLRIGTLVRDATGVVTFEVDENYIALGPTRPIVSLAWKGATEEQSIARLRSRNDKSTRGNYLPPYFENLLPEGALLELVAKEFGTGAYDSFDVLRKLGADLPGAVVAVAEAGQELPMAGGAPAGKKPADRPIRFSLAGIQLKFSMRYAKDRLTVPAHGEAGNVILKLATKKLAALPEAEFTALQLAKLAGVDVVESKLVYQNSIEGIPDEMIEVGTHALSVVRFDRAPEGRRIQTEDCAQIIGAVGDQKYTKANQDTLLNMARRFSDDSAGAILEGVRRIVVDIMVGNGDDHLKNWSFIFEDGIRPKLSPAYDIVPTAAYAPGDNMALKLAGTSDPTIVTIDRISSIAKFLKIDPAIIEREALATMEKILDTWKDAAKDLPAPKSITDAIFDRWDTLAIVPDARTRLKARAAKKTA